VNKGIFVFCHMLNVFVDDASYIIDKLVSMHLPSDIITRVLRVCRMHTVVYATNTEDRDGATLHTQHIHTSCRFSITI
jgi:hypothetical protein